jgi:hypothetical protein
MSLYFPVRFSSAGDMVVDYAKAQKPAKVTCQEGHADFRRARFGRSLKSDFTKGFTCVLSFAHQVVVDLAERCYAAKPLILPPTDVQRAVPVLLVGSSYQHPPEQDPSRGTVVELEFESAASAGTAYEAVVPVLLMQVPTLPAVSQKARIHAAIRAQILGKIAPSKLTVQEDSSTWGISRNKRSFCQQRLEWRWTAILSFTKQQSIESVEAALGDSPISILPDAANSLPGAFVEAASAQYAHPPQEGPNRGSVVAVNFHVRETP